MDGVDEDLIKDMNLTNQFMHLYRHTDFALTDFIYVRDFYSEINIEIKKGTLWLWYSLIFHPPTKKERASLRVPIIH